MNDDELSKTMTSRREVFELSVSAVLAGALVSIGQVTGCSGFEEKKAGSLVNIMKSVELIARDTAEAIFNRHKVQGTSKLIRHDVDVYRITYETRDTDSKRIEASGAILCPKGIERPRTMCYCRGTIIPVAGEFNAPSYYRLEKIKDVYDDHYEMSFLAATFASAGYLVVAADGIGYGASKDCEHPYNHAASLASTSLDMIRAAREFARREHLELDPHVFITGWSEGGLCGTALHKLIEDTCRDEILVAACSLLAGAYALSEMADLFCNFNENYPESQIYYWVLRSMARVYKLKCRFEKIVMSPFAAALAKDVLAEAPQNPRVGLVPEFRQAYLDDPSHEMRIALRDNDRYDWKPQAPVFLHHGTHDDIVPFFCAQMAYEAMRAKGARVQLYPYLSKDHYEPANAYVIRTLADFEPIPLP
jgi:pimeloyl-ACP methyl ester carboxylesterase